MFLWCYNPEGQHINLHHDKNLTYYINQFSTTVKDAVIKFNCYCTFKGQFSFIYRNKYIFIIVSGELWVTLNNMNYFEDFASGWRCRKEESF